MGYMGLENWGASDNAADATGDAIDAMVISLKKSLKERGNEFNTDGTVNVALFFEAFIIPGDYSNTYNDNLASLVDSVVQKLQKLIADSKKAHWGNEENKKMHIKAYKRMLRNMRRFHRKMLVYN